MSLQPTIKANHYMVSAGHYLATEAGYKVLEAGGNAFDAGVASGIALGVVQPAALLAQPQLELGLALCVHQLLEGVAIGARGRCAFFFSFAARVERNPEKRKEKKQETFCSFFARTRLKCAPKKTKFAWPKRRHPKMRRSR